MGINAQVRALHTPQFPRTTDVALALYGVSLLHWPKPKQKRKERHNRC